MFPVQPEFPRSTMMLAKNPPFVVFVIMNIFLMYVIMGLYSNMPRYFEVHFMQPAYVTGFVGEYVCL